MSITDHDSIDGQERAITQAKKYGINYVAGVELNVTLQYNGGRISAKSHQDEPGKSPVSPRSVSLDFLGYRYDINNQELKIKLQLMREHRESRARQILENLNTEFDKENIPRFSGHDIEKISAGVFGALGRPHIAKYLVEKGIVRDIQEAFDKYLVKCDVPKYPLSLAEASRLIRNAGGVLVHAHPNDSQGTSLVAITSNLDEQTSVIEEYVLDYIDGIECWHSRHDTTTTEHYLDFARKHRLLMTGGSDCHQKPIIMGTLDMPGFVADQFR